MKTLLSLVFFVVLIPVSVVGNAASYSWEEMKATAGNGENLASYSSGAPVRFCLAYQGKPTCKVVATVPADFDCVSVFDEKSGLWFNLGDIPGIDAVEGDGSKTCHGRVIPAGQWWGVNQNYGRRQ